MKPPRVNLHSGLSAMAESLVPRCCVRDSIEKVFHLDRFLEVLTDAVEESLVTADESPLGDFSVNPGQIARYLWACLALSQGATPAGDRFKGMRIVR